MVAGAALLLVAVVVQIVLLERADKGPDVETPVTAPAAPPPGDLLARDLAFPVRGIELASIADSFTDARGATRVHNAMDIMAARGTPVVAVDAGRVSRLGKGGAGGITVYQVDQAGRYGFYYAHLDRLAPGLAVGQAIRRGDVLGYVGTTGNAPASAPHLHFAIYEMAAGRGPWGGRPINPYPVWKKKAAAD
jgi:murein DD-endopeptidase MepM/ murein hydrolase activator NlpD